MSDSDEPTVPVSELHGLLDAWADIYRTNQTGDLDYYDGMAEGARSAALELLRVVENHEGTLHCELCGAETESITLTGDGHPEGVNHLVGGCCSRTPSGGSDE